MADNTLNLYKIPSIDTSLSQDVNNPAQVSISKGGGVEGSPTAGISEQQVRDIVGQNISTGLKEEQVRDIINSNIGATILREDQVRTIVDNAMKSGNVMTETKVRAIVNSMQKFLQGDNVMMTGIQKSQNFYTGISGWQIDAEGNAEFNDGTFRGTFNIGGTTITIDNTEDIQTNLDIISAAGGGTLFLQNGTYTLTSDILIPSGVTLQGVSRDGVIIDCNTSYAVKIAGTNVYSTGTVTVTNGGTTVTGSGTTWTSGMVGRYILLDGLWYEITARASNTSITITTYQGVNLAGSAYVLADVVFAGYLINLTITGATGSGLVVQYSMEPKMENLYVYGCGTGIDMDYVTYPEFAGTFTENGVNVNLNFVEGPYTNFSDFSLSTTGAGIIATNTRNGTIFNFSCNDNTGDGINATTCSKLAFISFDISGNGGQGVEFVSGCDDNQFTDGVIDGNTSDGIKLTATSDRNTLVSVSIKNNGGYGINIAASTCDNNQIIAPAFDNNTSGNINDQGTNTFVSPQEVGGDIQTFTATGAGTWTKPSGFTTVRVQVWGAGGSGGKGSSGDEPGSGGGGGSYSEKTFAIGDLGATETISVGTGGVAQTTASTDGNVGGNSTFGASGTLVTAYGGGGGGRGGATGVRGGGGGGGLTSVGLVGLGSGVGGAGGQPSGTGLGGVGGAANTNGNFNTIGGGGGAGAGTTGSIGGSSTSGGGGGGGGDNNGSAGGAGGVSFSGGAGGGGGGQGGAGGTGGSGGVSLNGGNGGAGSINNTAATAGSQPGGGGGGSQNGDSGAGGNGKVVVITT